MFPVDAPTSTVHAIAWDGEVAWVATAGGVEVYDADGELLARAQDMPDRDVRAVLVTADAVVVATDSGAFRSTGHGWSQLSTGPVAAVLPTGPVPQDPVRAIVDAVAWREHVVVARADGSIELDGAPVDVDCPAAVDLAVAEGELRIACVDRAIRWGDQPTVVAVAAMVAGPAWGTADGVLVDDAGRRIAAVPGQITAIDAVPGGWLVGSDKGLFRIGRDTTRLSRDFELCGRFVTSLTRWQGHLVAGTFDGGACVLDERGWTPITGLPSPLVNEVLAQGDLLWVGTSEGLVRVGPSGTQSFAEVADDAPRGAPGLNHPTVNGLAVGTGGLWVADVLGPVQVGTTWQRHRWAVGGHSYQTIAACPTGEVWIGSEDDGLAVKGVAFGRRNGRSSWRHVNVLDGLPEDWVMAVACAGPDAAWVGTYRHGVGRIDGSGWHPIEGLEDAWIQALAVDGDTLWIGTADGLFAVRNASVEAVTTDDVWAILSEPDAVRIGTREGIVTIANQ